MSKNKKILFILIICGLMAVLLPSVAQAQFFGQDFSQPSGGSGGGTAPVKFSNPLGTADLPTLIGRVISAVLGIVGSIALLMFIYGGFLWLTSAGAEQKITQGKNILVWATIGLAIIFLSYTLVGFVIKGLTSTTKPGGGVDVESAGMAINGCCVSPSGCAAGTNLECKKDEVFYPKICNDVPTCQTSTAGCCNLPSNTCQNVSNASDCSTFPGSAFGGIGTTCKPSGTCGY